MIKSLEWDSSFFGIKVGICEGKMGALLSSIELYDLIYGVNLKNLQDFINFSKTYQETKVIYEKNVESDTLNNFLKVENHIFSVFEITTDIEKLYRLAIISGEFSRFNLDPKIPKSKFVELYKLWIDNSLNRELADEIFVYRELDEIIGMVTVKLINNDLAKIGLIAVEPGNQGKGIGRSLLMRVEKYLAERGISKLQIPTQLQNEKACHFYETCGYQIKSKCIVTHLWKK